MKICVVGIGAIGGLIGARLAQTAETVTLVDIGSTQEALRQNELLLRTTDGEELRAHDAIVCDLEDAGPQDLVVLAVKAHDLPAVARGIPGLYHQNTMVMPVQNGMPWWYFQRHVDPWNGRRINSLDPDGIVANNIPAERILGSVVYPAAEVLEPGVIRHVEGNRIVIGELDDCHTERADAVIGLLKAAGFKSFFLDDLRGEVWLKLLGSAVFNPLSALTRATMVEMCQFPPTRKLVTALMEEVEAVATAFDVKMRLSIERRLEGAEKVGHHKTSTLQDLEAGRRLEVDALMGAVVEIARWTNVETPRLDAIEAAVRLLDKETQEGQASKRSSVAATAEK